MTDASAAPPRAFATATIRWAHGCRVPTSAAPNVSRTVILRFSTRRRGRSVNLVSATNRASVRVSFMRLRREYTGVGGDVKLAPRCARSEEHTSELQSRGHLVCRLLLEKKNSVANYFCHSV